MGETCGLFLSCLPRPPLLKAPLGPVGLQMKKEIIGGVWGGVLLSLWHLKKNKIVFFIVILHFYVGWVWKWNLGTINLLQKHG